MEICAKWLHMPLREFFGLPEEEQMLWQLWYRETVRRTELVRAEQAAAEHQAELDRTSGSRDGAM